MIKVLCQTEETATISHLQFFQGDLKKRTTKDIDALKRSLKEDGLVTPFMVWQNDNTNKLLDGHGRLEALIRIAVEDPTVISQEFPILKIEAPDEETARQALLQINTQYGKVTSTGYAKFTATIPNYVPYKAPKVKAVKPLKVPETADKVVVRLRVERSKYAKLIDLLKQTEGLEVL